jgi:uncharacterized peroxidase-related enzyme
MPYFSALGADAGVRDILKMNRAAGRALVQFHEAVLRQPSPLTIAERELIAALVSGLNSCRYCYGVHARTATELGGDEAQIAALVSDIDSADVAPKMRPLLRFARKLTLNPASIRRTDAAEVFAAGWNEQALHDAILVTCLFNFMNRLVDGHGVEGSGALYEQRGQQLAAGGYLPLLEVLAEP